VHPEDRANLQTGMNALKAGTPLSRFEGRFRRKDGDYRWLEGTAVPFLAENLIYIFARDITPRREAEEKVNLLNVELRQRVADLTAVNQELEAFNYSIAHDLRSPLRSMSGFSQALLEDETTLLSARGLEYAQRISRSARYMDTLLLDLLNYSRFARADVPPEVISLDAAIQDLLGIVEREIRERGVKVEVTSPLGQVYAHLPTLQQILSNLIGNSLKFQMPDRPPSMRIFTVPKEGRIRICVEDNGIGIAEEHHERIFGLFQRLHDVDKYPGTGIGLALVRKGTERMGGVAGVESKPGLGSCFWVELPSQG